MNKSEEKIIEWFEQNYLDGDKIQDGQALHPAECINAILSALASQKAEIVTELKKKWNCHQIGCDWNRTRIYGNKVCDMNCSNVLDIINNLTAKAGERI